MRVPLIAPTTGSATAELNTGAVRSVTLSADNLATTEEVDILLDGKAITDDTGTVKKLTASIPAIVIEGGNVYSVLKDATAGSCGVYFSVPPGVGAH